ncbi:MAG: cardiolipin synthase [Caldilineaceae bacterium]
MASIVANVINHVPTVIWWLAALYAIVVGIFMVLENNDPSKTIAWLACFLLIPVLGVIVYFMFGRDYRAFSREKKLLRQELGNHLTSNSYVSEFLAHQPAEHERLRAAGPSIYQRALELMRRNGQNRLYPYNSLEILQNATEKYPRLLADLQAAQHSIHMEYFEWSSDEFMQKVKQILLERAKAGVEVRVIYDPLGCLTMLSWWYVREMNLGGVKMIPWSRLYAIHTLSYRSHRKIAVIDGKIGYTGGMNMSEEYLCGPKHTSFTGWRDTHVRVTGQVVLGLQANFAVQWYNTTKELLTDPSYYPAVTEEHPYLPLQIVNSGPDAKWKAIRELYFALITGAQKHVYIQSPFFILDQGLAEALAGAARSGVDVKIMIAPKGPGFNFPYRAGFTYAENMAEAGVKLFLYQGEYFHPKTLCVDSMICTIGSTNLDIRSFSINYELNLIVYDENVARDLEKDFIHDLQHCTQFSLRSYKRSSITQRILDSVSRLLSPLL